MKRTTWERTSQLRLLGDEEGDYQGCVVAYSDADLFQRAAATIRPPMASETRTSTEVRETQRHVLDPPDTERYHIKLDLTDDKLKEAGRLSLSYVYRGPADDSDIGNAGVKYAGRYALVR